MTPRQYRPADAVFPLTADTTSCRACDLSGLLPGGRIP